MSSSISDLQLAVPSHFTKLEIISCRTGPPHLRIRAESTYHNVRLFDLLFRPAGSNRTWDFVRDNQLAFIPPEPAKGDGPPKELRRGDRPSFQRTLPFLRRVVAQESRQRLNRPLPWAATAAAATGVGTIVVNLSGDGLIITASTVGGALMAGGVMAAGAAAVVYFMPWTQLGRWMRNAWSHFLAVIKACWKFFKDEDNLSLLLEGCLRILRAWTEGRRLLEQPISA